MMAPPRHPSFLELDRAALGVRGPELEQHLQGCAECGAYLARVTRPEPVPAWVRVPVTDTRADRRASWRRWGWPLLATAALASLVLVVIPGSPPGDDAPYMAPKGLPSVAVHIKRGDQVFLWDGQAPLVPEDRIRLKVASEAHRYVTVAAPSEEYTGGWMVLFAGPLSSEPETALPASWRVDDAGGEERLRVIFSTEPLPGARTAELFSEAPRTANLWTTELRLPKSPPP